MILTLMEIVTATDIEAAASNTSTDGALYQLRNGSDIGYKMKSIIQQLEDVSRVACILSCNGLERCDHVIFNGPMKRCKLLTDVVSVETYRSENQLTGEEIIYSRRGTFY